jgi:cation diffusion facilitator CzcD-associated flavoprotein CzcO
MRSTWLVLATGFRVLDVDSGTFPLIGAHGQSLAEFWSANRMQAYEGVSVPGFPNSTTCVVRMAMSAHRISR